MPDKPREISKKFTVQAYIHGPYRTLRDLLKYPKLSERLKYRWLGNRDRDANRQTALIGWLMFRSPKSNYALLPLSKIAFSTSDARIEKCAAGRSNSSRFLKSVAKSRISSHSAASLRSFSNWVSMSCIVALMFVARSDTLDE